MQENWLHLDLLGYMGSDARVPILAEYLNWGSRESSLPSSGCKLDTGAEFPRAFHLAVIDYDGGESLGIALTKLFKLVQNQ